MDADWQRFFRRRAAQAREDYVACDYASQASFDWRHESILAWLGPQQGHRILDVGCGPGRFARPLCEHNLVVGVDFVAEMAARARERGLRAVQAHTVALPLADEQFDLVLCIEVLQCVDDWRGAIREQVRVLKPGGTLVLATLTDSVGRRILYRVTSGIGTEQRLIPRVFAVEEVLAVLRANGMAQTQVLTLYYPVRYRQVSAGDGLLQILFSSSFVVRAVKQ